MKRRWWVLFVCMGILSQAGLLAQDALPPQGQAVRDELAGLARMAKEHPTSFRRNVNTHQQQLDTIEFFDEITVAGKTVVTFPAADVTLLLKYFRGFAYTPEGDIDLAWSTDGEKWQTPAFWWKAADGRQARLACGAVGRDLHLRFSGQGRVRRLVWTALTPITLEFDPEPFLVPGASLPEVTAEVRVVGDEKMAFAGDASFARRKWMRVYNKPDAVVIPEFMEASEYFVERGFAASRDAGYRLTDSPDKTFAPDRNALGKLEKLYPEGLDCVVCFDALPPDLQCTDATLASRQSCPDRDRFREAAERVAATIAQRQQKLGRYAGPYCEVKNESDISRNWGYFANPKAYDAWRLLAEYHNEVARAVKKRNPGWKVGGPSSCLPRFDSDGFERGRQMLKFAERTCADLDYYSWHFYERNSFHLDRSHSYLFGRLPASIDLYRSHLRLNGGEKPLVITEYGGSAGDASDIGVWTSLRSINQLMLQMMEYPDLIEMAVPFVIPVSWWHKRDPHFTPDSFRLFLYDKDKRLQLTKVGALLEFWRDVDGVRVPVASSRPDVHAMACRNGNVLYIALSNLSGHRLRTSLQVATGDARIRRIRQRRLYIERAELQSRTDELVDLQSVPVAFDETTLLVIELDKAPEWAGRRNRQVFCAKEILLPTGKAAAFTIRLAPRDLAPANCMLRLGLWRQGCFPAGGTVVVNGQEFPIAGFRDIATSWFGVREIEIPTDILRPENRIVVRLADPGGLVTSAVLHNTYREQLTK